MLTNAMEVRGFCCRGANAFDVCFGLEAQKEKNAFTPESSVYRRIALQNIQTRRLSGGFFFPPRRVFPAVLQLEKMLMDFTEKLQHL